MAKADKSSTADKPHSQQQHSDSGMRSEMAEAAPSLQKRLLIWTVVSLLLVAVVAGGYGFWRTFNDLNKWQQTNLKNIAMLLASAPPPRHLSHQGPHHENDPATDAQNDAGQRSDAQNNIQSDAQSNAQSIHAAREMDEADRERWRAARQRMQERQRQLEADIEQAERQGFMNQNSVNQARMNDDINTSMGDEDGTGTANNTVGEEDAPDIRQYDSQRDGEIRVQVIPLPLSRLTERQRARIEERRTLEVPEGFGEQTFRGERWQTFRVNQDHQIVIVRQKATLQNKLAMAGAWQAFIPVLLALLILMILLPTLLWRMFRPVRALSEQVSRRDSMDLTPLQVKNVPSELMPLLAAINRLLARVNLHVERQQRFIADAAHELRSPLTAISLQVQRLQRLAQQSAGSKSINAEHASAESAHADSVGSLQRLVDGLDKLDIRVRHNQHLVEQLLTLARVEAVKETQQQTSLTAVLAQVVSLLLPIADHKNLSLSLLGVETVANVSGDVLVAMDDTSLLLVLKNLVQNAILYTPEQGSVSIQLTDTERLLRQQEALPAGSAQRLVAVSASGAVDQRNERNERNERDEHNVKGVQPSGSMSLPYASFSKPPVKRLVLQVIDSGIGMDASDYEQAFTPFVRLGEKNGQSGQVQRSDSAGQGNVKQGAGQQGLGQQAAGQQRGMMPQEEVKGTGLGLAIVQQICQQAGVDIYVSASTESNHHAGLTVTLVFPK